MNFFNYINSNHVCRRSDVPDRWKTNIYVAFAFTLLWKETSNHYWANFLKYFNLYSIRKTNRILELWLEAWKFLSLITDDFSKSKVTDNGQHTHTVFSISVKLLGYRKGLLPLPIILESWVTQQSISNYDRIKTTWKLVSAGILDKYWETFAWMLRLTECLWACKHLRYGSFSEN